MNYLEYLEELKNLKKISRFGKSITNKASSDMLKFIASNGINDSKDDLFVINHIMKYHKDIYEENAISLLQSNAITNFIKETIIAATIANDTSFVTREIEVVINDRFKDEESEKSEDKVERTSFLKEAINVCIGGRIGTLENFFKTIKNMGKAYLLKDKLAIEEISKEFPVSVIKSVITVFDKNEIEDTRDLIKYSLKQINDGGSLKELVHSYINRKQIDREVAKQSRFKLNPNRYTSFVNDYLGEILESSQMADRADILLLSLMDDNVSSDTLSNVLSKVRREDIAIMIGSLINEDKKFTLLSRTVLEENSLHNQITNFNVLKSKLLKAFMINEDSKNTIFQDISMRKYSYKEKRLLDAFIKLDIDVVNKIERDKCQTEEGYNLNMMLASYEIKNLVLLLSDNNQSRLCKSINNIIKDNETYVNVLETERIDNGDFKYEDQSQRQNIRESVPRLDIIKLYSKLRELKIHEFYKNVLGLDNTCLNHNPNIDKSITYGVEVEEINVACDLDILKYTNGFEGKKEYSLQLRNNDGAISNDTKYQESGTYGEYITSIFQAQDKTDLELVRDEFELLKDLGGTTNSSCGMHIHVADKKIDKYKDKLKTKITSDVFYLQKALADKFQVYKERLNDTCAYLEFSNPYYNVCRYKLVNIASLEKHGTIEFRFFNMPDELDPYLVESYIDFATSFYQYERFGKETLEEVIERKIDNDEHLIFRNDKEKYDYQLKEALNLIGVTEETKKVIINQDKIFEFYGAMEKKDKKVEDRIDYYTRINQTIGQINLENLYEEKTETRRVNLLPLINENKELNGELTSELNEEYDVIE